MSEVYTVKVEESRPSSGMYHSPIVYVPLYATLGANAAKFIINHAEVSIAFVQENKIASIWLCIKECSSNLKTIVSFGNISSSQKQQAENFCVPCLYWE